MYTLSMFTNKNDDSVHDFWKEFEESTGEKVLAKSLGRYLSGLDDRLEALWGLAVVTSGGLRFRHFPKEPSIFGIAKLPTGGKAPKEQSFFIPKEAVVSIELFDEKRWWKKIMASSFPVLVICCRINEDDKKISIEIDRDAVSLVDALNGLCNAG